MKVYADHAATTTLCAAAFNAMLPFLREDFGNPSSRHVWARKPREAVARARETIARCINAEPENTRQDIAAILAALKSLL